MPSRDEPRIQIGCILWEVASGWQCTPRLQLVVAAWTPHERESRAWREPAQWGLGCGSPYLLPLLRELLPEAWKEALTFRSVLIFTVKRDV